MRLACLFVCFFLALVLSTHALTKEERNTLLQRRSRLVEAQKDLEEKLALVVRFLRDEPSRRLEYVDVRSTEHIVFCPDRTLTCPE